MDYDLRFEKRQLMMCFFIQIIRKSSFVNRKSKAHGTKTLYT